MYEIKEIHLTLVRISSIRNGIFLSNIITIVTKKKTILLVIIMLKKIK